nr:MAG TPA_asm: hypothetical protein [Caudoviricetes sp.]
MRKHYIRLILYNAFSLQKILLLIIQNYLQLRML